MHCVLLQALPSQTISAQAPAALLADGQMPAPAADRALRVLSDLSLAGWTAFTDGASWQCQQSGTWPLKQRRLFQANPAAVRAAAVEAAVLRSMLRYLMHSPDGRVRVQQTYGDRVEYCADNAELRDAWERPHAVKSDPILRAVLIEIRELIAKHKVSLTIIAPEVHMHGDTQPHTTAAAQAPAAGSLPCSRAAEPAHVPLVATAPAAAAPAGVTAGPVEADAARWPRVAELAAPAGSAAWPSMAANDADAAPLPTTVGMADKTLMVSARLRNDACTASSRLFSSQVISLQHMLLPRQHVLQLL